jgi:ureidoglycolate hydrolase
MEMTSVLELKTDTFSDFGQIMSLTDAKPMGVNPEYSYWGRVGKMQFGPSASSGILLCNDRAPVVKSFERHEKTPEVLVALEGDSVLCLARPTKQPSGIRWFRIHEGNAVALHPGTWHWIPFPLGGHACRFLVIFALGTEEDDLQYVDLDEPVNLVI